MGGRGGSSGITAGFANSTLRKSNPYMKLTTSQIRKEMSIIGGDIRKAQSEMYRTGNTSLQSKINSLDLEYAKAEFALNNVTKKKRKK